MPFAATMRPRSIGTRSSVAPGACVVHEGVEAVGVGSRDIEEEERRRVFRQRGGEFAMQIAVDLDHGDQQARGPSPSDSMTLGVSAPARWILAMASRSTVERWRGRRRAIHIVSIATSRSSRKTTAAATTKRSRRRGGRRW